MTVKFVYYVIREEKPMAIYMDDTGSHLSQDGLGLFKIPIPLTPDYKTWRLLIEKKLKCPHCYAFTRSATDWMRHVSIHEDAEIEHQGPPEKDSEGYMLLYSFDNHSRMDKDY